MQMHLDYDLEYSTDIEHKSLYGWCLREIDQEGNQLGRDQIPWNWSLNFQAKEIRISTLVGVENDNFISNSVNEETTQDEEITKVAVTEKISGTLVPSPSNEWEPQTDYSMLGTDRVIKEISFSIEQSEDQGCHIWGCPSYTTDIDFRDVTTDDGIFITLLLNKENFENVSHKIKSGKLDDITVSLARVRGFYSEWSPSVSTSKIKILGSTGDQIVKIPKGNEIDPPRLGYVGEFHLKVGTIQELSVKHENNEYHDDLSDDIQPTFVEEKVNNQNTFLQENFREITYPLWGIIILLFLILLNVW